MRVCMLVYICTYIPTYQYECIHTHTLLCIGGTCVCMYTRMCVYIYMYVYKHTHKYMEPDATLLLN